MLGWRTEGENIPEGIVLGHLLSAVTRLYSKTAAELSTERKKTKFLLYKI